jgi:uncharacterized protein YeaO (DUF488 family)
MRAYVPSDASDGTRKFVDRMWPRASRVHRLTDLVSAGKVALLFGAHDIEHNNVVALADYLAAN